MLQKLTRTTPFHRIKFQHSPHKLQFFRKPFHQFLQSLILPSLTTKKIRQRGNPRPHSLRLSHNPTDNRDQLKITFRPKKSPPNKPLHKRTPGRPHIHPLTIPTPKDNLKRLIPPGKSHADPAPPPFHTDPKVTEHRPAPPHHHTIRLHIPVDEPF
jgi:hypothetical protein